MTTTDIANADNISLTNEDDVAVDVIIVGGAMVGGTLALALAQHNYSVLLVDSRNINSNSSDTSAIDRRTTALSSSSALILGAFGIWPQLESHCCPIKSVHVSQQGNFGQLSLSAEEFDLPALGYVSDNTHYLRTLNHLLTQQNSVVFASESEVTQYYQSRDSVRVSVKSRTQERQQVVQGYRARLLVAADGADSNIRERLGIGAQKTDYQQHAIIANIETELPHQHTAYERFTKSGPLAILPVADCLCSAIYTVDSTRLPDWLDLSSMQNNAQQETVKQHLCEEIQKQFGQRLGRITACSTPSVYPLVLKRADRTYDGRTLFMGNALRTLHPVAGQGFNLALRDVGKLVELLAKTQSRADPGAASVLAEFSRARARDQAITLGVTDFLARVFRGENRPFSHLRAVGLMGLNSLPPLKRAFGRRAMGYGAALPDLDYRK